MRALKPAASGPVTPWASRSIDSIVPVGTKRFSERLPNVWVSGANPATPRRGTTRSIVNVLETPYASTVMR